MRPDLLAWQWELYARNHRDRGNLLLHAVVVPLFQAGSLAVLTAPLTAWPAAVAGLATCAASMAAQGRGHRKESEAPVPFDGPLDVVTRIVAEQWVTFPRFVLSGGFARAWREAGAR